MFNYLNQIKKSQCAVLFVVGLGALAWISTKEKTRDTNAKARVEVRERSRLAEQKQNPVHPSFGTRSPNPDNFFPPPNKTSFELAQQQLEGQELDFTATHDQELCALLKTAKGYEWNAILAEMEKRADPEIIDALLDNITSIRAPFRVNEALQDMPEDRFPVCSTLSRMKNLPLDRLVQNTSSDRSLEERILTARVLINQMALVPENIKHSDYSFLSEHGFERFRETLVAASLREELVKLFPVESVN